MTEMTDKYNKKMLWFKLTPWFFDRLTEEDFPAEAVTQLRDFQDRKDDQYNEAEEKNEGEGFAKDELLKVVEKQIGKELMPQWRDRILEYARSSTIEFLQGRTKRFFDRYDKELINLAKLLEVRLKSLTLAYTLEQNLPQDSIQIMTRVKTIDSTLRKLEENNWPYFYYPTNIIQDLLGARIICWFIDDCEGILQFLHESKQLTIHPDSIENFMQNPSQFGYRAIHLLADITYDRVKNENGRKKIIEDSMVCEIQIKTMLQNALAIIMHPIYKCPGFLQSERDRLIIKQIANHLMTEEHSVLVVKEIIQDMIQKTYGKHEGFKKGA